MEENAADKQARETTVQTEALICARTHSSLYFLISSVSPQYYTDPPFPHFPHFPRIA